MKSKRVDESQMWKSMWKGIPKLPALLLGEAAIFLLVALVIYELPSHEHQTMGFAIPGAIIGVLGLTLTFRSPGIRRKLAATR